MEEWESNLAIIILNYNGYELTIENAKKLRSFSDKLNLVIVDNCSKNDSAKIIKEAFATDENTYVIENTVNSGYAAGNNVGLRFVSENLKNVDAVCISNPDIVVDSLDVLKSLYDKLFADDKLAILTAMTIYNGTIRKPNDCGWSQPTKKYMMFGSTCLNKILSISIRYNEFKPNDNGIAYMYACQGCFFMAKQKIMEEINYFDEGTFLYHEEVILASKVKNAGYLEGVAVDEYINHNHQVKDKSLVKKANKIFDMNCFYHSKKYYNAKFSGKSRAFTLLANGFLNIDYFIKRCALIFK